MAGLVNVAAELEPGWHQVTPAQVAKWQPDLIVTEQPGLPAKLAADPAWSMVTAVGAGGVHVAPAAPFGWIEGPPGPNRLLGLYWLDAVAYPGSSGVDLGRAGARVLPAVLRRGSDPRQSRSLLSNGQP